MVEKISVEMIADGARLELSAGRAEQPNRVGRSGKGLSRLSGDTVTHRVNRRSRLETRKPLGLLGESHKESRRGFQRKGAGNQRDQRALQESRA